MLTRKMLSAMGIESDKIDEIISAHSDTVNGLKEEIDKYKADAARLESVQKELETLQKSGEKSPYKVKYEALVEEREELRKEFEDYKNGVEAEKSKAKKKDAYRQLLRDTGVSEKRIEAVLKVSDFESLELAEDGTIKEREKLADSIKTEWSDFIATEREEAAYVASPPASNTNGTPMTREEIMKIKNTSERQKAWEKFLENERKK